MCGIIGYCGYDRKNTIALALDMLRRLEYRGYDSAGLAFIYGDDLSVIKTKGSISKLQSKIKSELKMLGRTSNVVIGHTRWATHGAPSDANAHPHTDCKFKVAIAHNGIIENYRQLKLDLKARGHIFKSETDSEVIAHLIEEELSKDREPYKAFLNAIRHLEGSYAVVCIIKGENRIFFARKESPLLLGLSTKENILASDIPAMLKYTDRFIFLDDFNAGYISANGYTITDLDSNPVSHEVHVITMSPDVAERGGYEHFMLKEIFEQPRAIHAAIRGRLEAPYLDLSVLANGEFDYDGIKFVACGTSLHAAIVGRYLFENILGMPCTVEYASEFRYSKLSDSNPLVVAISQSGETADTLAALRLAKKNNLSAISITNVVGSSITRISDDVIYTHAGPEIGVAATKTFTNQIAVIMILLLAIGHATDIIDPSDEERLRKVLHNIPRLIDRTLSKEEGIKKHAKFIASYENAFFIGRRYGYPTAMEGALKLKEISYIHAEAYPAGELKHGPLALLTEKTPVIAIINNDITRDKILGNVGEVLARQSPVIAVCQEGDSDVANYVDRVIYIPATAVEGSPILATVALQMLAYHTARIRGCEIDKPRNLAKSVTVE